MLDALTLTDLKENRINAVVFRSYLRSPHRVVRDYAEKLENAGEALADGEEQEAMRHLARANSLYEGIVHLCHSAEVNGYSVGSIAHDSWDDSLPNHDDCFPAKRVELNLLYLFHLARCYQTATGERLTF